MAGVEKATQVEVGAGYACALTSDGALTCFGENRHGQCGNGTTGSPAPAGRAIGLGAVSEVHLAGSHACALMHSGRVACWGHLDASLLGRSPGPEGPLELHTEPTEVAGLRGVKQIIMAENDACALLTTGRVSCWGEHRATGTHCHPGPADAEVCDNRPSPRPALLAGVRGVKAITRDGGFVLLSESREDSPRWAVDFGPEGVGPRKEGPYGDRYRQRVGAVARVVRGGHDPGRRGPRGTPARSPVEEPPCRVPDSLQVIWGDTDFACAVRRDRSVVCCGGNLDGQLGTLMPHPAIPIRVELPPAATR
jgi:alpha-tubulin suppressor-like RCC1 family protein